jgi:hypothetical protein
MEPLSRVYYVPVDGDGNEVGEPLEIHLTSNGSADLSQLPKDLQDMLAAGVPDELHQGVILPSSGPRFLAALLQNANGYLRFRSSLTRV